MIDTRLDVSFFKLLSGSYNRLSGKSLVAPCADDQKAARWLYEEAPFAVLAHNTEPDPVFIYANIAAQLRFEYSWEELMSLPSRLSAEVPHQQAREQFLELVNRNGFVSGYCGTRITKTGRRFQIADATVWRLVDSQGVSFGQAAMLL